MTKNSRAFDHWLRHDFVEINNALEDLYWQQEDKANVEGIGENLKTELTEQGNALVEALRIEGNTDEGFDSAFDLLGNVGLFMAACRRHEITEPSRERTSPLTAASALAMHIGASIGVTPRFATAHLTTHNRAADGVYKRFTDLVDEKVFIDYNTRGILAYKRAAEALVHLHPLGISHPCAPDLFNACTHALEDVLASNATLFDTLDAERFFYCVRPYYKPHRVGSQVYRGANAGDFAGINVLDMLLGLCNANEASYSQILVDKFLYMMPEDQTLLRHCMRLDNYLDAFIAAKDKATQPWYQTSLNAFLGALTAHGKTAAQHHDQLVEKYIAVPSDTMEKAHLSKVTASGPPLHVLMQSLENLRDKRLAAPREDINTSYEKVSQLRSLLGDSHV